jgi:hypothetical protein
VDLPEDGSDSTFDGRDGNVDGTDENTVEIAPQCVSKAAAPSKTTRETTRDQFYDWTSDLTRFTQNAYLSDFSEERGAMDLKEYCAATHFIVRMLEHEHGNTLQAIEERIEQIEHLLPHSFDAVLTKLSELTLKNTALRRAYHKSTTETVALKTAVDRLTKRLDNNIAPPVLPPPQPTASSTTMEEMTMQLSVVQNHIQDVLAAVRNPPSKRKRRGSDQNTGPTMPTNQRPATNKKRDASPEHSLMHSQHATSTAQDALDALMRKYPPRPLAITSTEVMTDPLPDSNAAPDTTLPDAPTTTGPAAKDGWNTVEGK